MASHEPTAAAENKRFRVDNLDSWRTALKSRRPLLAHLNADTTWFIQLPYPEGSPSKAAHRSRFNILVDPWLGGPQSDVASWFSTQWHVVAPSVGTVAELNTILKSLEDASSDISESFIDAVVISHEFTDHCHQATLLELPKPTPVFATEKAAKLISSWNHFDIVAPTPGFSSSSSSWQSALADSTSTLPPWLGIGRVITAGNALYYHSAVVIAYDLEFSTGPAARTRSKQPAAEPSSGGEAVIYSPHGIRAEDLSFLPGSGLKTAALLHGLHDVRIWATKQLNLGALNGIQAARACGARYWIATHDERKKGGGLISLFLRRTAYTLKDAAASEESTMAKAKATEGGDRKGKDGDTGYEFLELDSGDAVVL